MVCLYCGAATNVVNTRLKRRDNHTWRRRACSTCTSIFTTIERPDLAGSIMVSNHRGLLTPFNRDRLFLSVYKSCEHRSEGIDDAAALTQIVIANLLQRPASSATLSVATIADTTLEALRRFDATAATVYAAYYRQS